MDGVPFGGDVLLGVARRRAELHGAMSEEHAMAPGYIFHKFHKRLRGMAALQHLGRACLHRTKVLYPVAEFYEPSAAHVRAERRRRQMPADLRRRRLYDRARPRSDLHVILRARAP